MIFETILVGPLQVNCYIVGCAKSKQAAVIDPGDDEGLILNRCRDLGLSIEHILLTHGHVDHIGGVNPLQKKTGAPVLIHKGDDFLIGTATSQAQLFDLRDPGAIKIDRFLQDGQLVSVGDVALRVISTPGHSPGGVCFAFDGLVFSGDTLFYESIGRTDFPGGSMEQLLTSINERLFVLDDDTRVFPGHGPETTVGHEKRNNPFLTGDVA